MGPPRRGALFGRPAWTRPTCIQPWRAKADTAKEAAFERNSRQRWRKATGWLAVLRAEVAESPRGAKAAARTGGQIQPEPAAHAGRQSGGGQWTDRSGGQGQSTSLAQPMGNVEVGDPTVQANSATRFTLSGRHACRRRAACCE